MHVRSILRVDDDRDMKEASQEIADHDDVGADDAEAGDDDVAVDGGGMSATKRRRTINDSSDGDGGGSSDSASSIKQSGSSSGSISGSVRQQPDSDHRNHATRFQEGGKVYAHVYETTRIKNDLFDNFGRLNFRLYDDIYAFLSVYI